MIGILIVTHGKLAEGFLDSAEMIMGKQENMQAIGLYPDSDLEHFKDVVRAGMDAVNCGNGVLVFVDMFGASPCNFAAANIAQCLEEGIEVRVITGLNLGILIESLSMRTFINDVHELYPKLIATGKEGIKELMETLQASYNKEDA